MKVRAYVLFVAVALLAVSAGTKNAKPTVGINPGDLAPRIESLGNESNFSFQNHSGRYTLLNFWQLTMLNRGLVTFNYGMKSTS